MDTLVEEAPAAPLFHINTPGPIWFDQAPRRGGAARFAGRSSLNHRLAEAAKINILHKTKGENVENRGRAPASPCDVKNCRGFQECLSQNRLPAACDNLAE